MNNLGQRIMKRSRFHLLVIFIFAIAAGSVAAEMDTVKVGFGSMSLHMNLQAGFGYYIGDETLGTFNDSNNLDNPLNGSLAAIDRATNYEFTVDRFRLILKGHILTDKIVYLAQAELAAKSVELYDAFIGFRYIPFTTINFGKFIPNYGFFGDRSTADLILIDYPFYALKWYNDNARGFRHVGLWFDFKSQYVDAQVGVWNGFTGVFSLDDDVAVQFRGANLFSDTNSGKDVNVSITGKPVKGLEIRACFWWGQPLTGYELEDGEKREFNNTLYMFGGGVFYRADFGLLLAAEYHHRIFELNDFYIASPVLEDGKVIDTVDGYDPDPDSISSQSFYVLTGFNLDHFTGVPVEFVVRYDSFNPNIADDKDEASFFGKSDSANDLQWNITGGINYYFEGLHAVLRLNYIHQQEDWKDVVNKKGDDTQTGINNDLIKLQAQVAF